ncbi:20796_t:CDS:1 [Dentiscutata erythropus]|uniref:20796_t:CDS:1 n=1 Tax=Dentiscutata erythropus TaxID=1348616 RepID=A0A9N8ZRL8_9GLOM|nr:20796_t:CDS:1 [Dentiscutata erythropus]
MYSVLEKELLEYIKKKQKEKIAVTMLMIQRKAKELGETLSIENARFSCGWVVRFKHHHNLVQHACTQVAQKFPEDMLLVVRDFLKKSHEKTINIEKKFIIYFNETPNVVQHAMEFDT